MTQHKINPKYLDIHSYDENFSKNLSNDFLVSKYTVYIVYFINCLLNENYLEWVNFSIDKIKNFQYKRFFFCATVNDKIKKILLRKLETVPNINFVFNYKNEYEYPGINTLYTIATEHCEKTDIYLYFHAKGITHHKHLNPNCTQFKSIFDILNKYYTILNVFEVFPKINKCVVCSPSCGVPWYNFFYARGSYINTLEIPKKTKRRHYYEGWLRPVKKPNLYEYPDWPNLYEYPDWYSFRILEYNIGEWWHPHRGYNYIGKLKRLPIIS